ncbi:MAG: ABC transporter permease [Verrucomicrobia bacterium]|nr:ABC transporter permease [Verrucomicrobiota bacterium]MCH8528128.1 ABC transporter permease [Kiritimatiellia bacterium]
MKRSRFPLVVTVLVMLFFYLPVLVLVVNSFNRSRSSGPWTGFTLDWYVRLFGRRDIWEAFGNTLIIAVSASAASMLLGTLAAFALHRYRTRLQDAHYTMVYTPLVVPEILLGISLLLLFVALGVERNLTVLFIGHTTFCISYVTMVVLARLQDFDFAMVEAAQDLGAGPWTIARRVIIPLLAPGIFAGGLLAFTLSIDDYVISFFLSGPGTTTLPIKINAMIRRDAPALINALSSIMLCVTFLLVGLSQKLNKENRT